MNVADWKKTKEELVHAGDYRKIIRKNFILPDGKEGTFDIVHTGETVGVLALTEDNKVILARQFRPGPEQTYDELPGGLIDEGESPEEAIKREFLEETGYQGDFEFITTCAASPFSSRISHVFVATNCKKVKEPVLDHGEYISVIEKPLNEFKDQLRNGDITNLGVAYLGLDFLKLL